MGNRAARTRRGPLPKEVQIWLRLLFLVVVLLVSQSSLASSFPKRYDSSFKKAQIFLPPGVSWKLLKAQCWQESRLKPNAVSPKGAQGLCQFMPDTWALLRTSYPFLTTPFNPDSSVMAAALYMHRLYREWRAPRSPADRYRLALASYNAGLGNVLKAQKLSGNKTSYPDIIGHLSKVTGPENSLETTEYVAYIMDVWYPTLLGR